MAATKDSGTEIAFTSLHFGQGCVATDRKALAEYVEPSVAKRIFIPIVVHPAADGQVLEHEMGGIFSSLQRDRRFDEAKGI